MYQEIDIAIAKGFTADELQKTKAGYAEQSRTSLGNNAGIASIRHSFLMNNRNLIEFFQFDKK